MAVVFDFSKESNDYRQRIAVVFKSLFERDFLEYFDIFLEEIFKGNYSINALKEAVQKNKHVLSNDLVVGAIFKKKDNESKLAIEIMKLIILAMMFNEGYIKLKDIVDGIETKEDMKDVLGMLNYTLDRMIDAKNDIRKELMMSNLDRSQKSFVDDEVKILCDTAISRFVEVRICLVDGVLSLSDMDNEIRVVSEMVLEKMSIFVMPRDMTIGF